MNEQFRMLQPPEAQPQPKHDLRASGGAVITASFIVQGPNTIRSHRMEEILDPVGHSDREWAKWRGLND